MKFAAKFAIVSGLFLTALVVADPQAAEKVTPAYVPEQAQASALAVPAPATPAPVAVIVITACNQVVGVIATDATGTIHPLNIEGLSEEKLKAILASFQQLLVANTGCRAQPDKQPIF